MSARTLAGLLVSTVLAASSLGSEMASEPGARLRVAVLPCTNIETSFRKLHPLFEYLESRTGFKMKLVVPADLPEFETMTRSAGVDFALQDPHTYEQLAPLYEESSLLQTRGLDGATSQAAVVIVRRDSGVRGAAAAEGKDGHVWTTGLEREVDCGATRWVQPDAVVADPARVGQTPTAARVSVRHRIPAHAAFPPRSEDVFVEASDGRRGGPPEDDTQAREGTPMGRVTCLAPGIGRASPAPGRRLVVARSGPRPARAHPSTKRGPRDGAHIPVPLAIYRKAGLNGRSRLAANLLRGACLHEPPTCAARDRTQG